MSELDDLLATEERLERSLAEAKAEAARQVQAARAGVSSREARVEAELAELARGLAATAAAERAARTREIEAAAQREIAAYDDLPPQRVAELVRYVTSRVAAGECP